MEGMEGNEPSEPGSNGIPLIKRDELTEYSSMPGSRVRLFYRTKSSLGSSLEMAGDGFLRQDGDRFYVLLDWLPDECRYLSPGEIIGIQEESRIGFEPRMLMLEDKP